MVSRNWSAKTGYLFIDGGGSNNFLANPHAAANVPSSFDHNFHVIKTGLNYRFGGRNDEGLFDFFTAPPMPSNHDWSGFYAGVNAGAGMSNVDAPQTGTFPGRDQLNGAGLAGGGQVGFNVMNILGPKWFAGVEADFGALRVKSEWNDWFDEDVIFTVKTTWYGTARARFGVTTGPALLYVTGGAAWVHLTEGFAANPFAPNAQTGSRTAAGYTIGGGTEVAIDQRWSAKVESLFISAGHANAYLTNPPALRGSNFTDRFMVVRAGLNYKIW